MSAVQRVTGPLVIEFAGFPSDIVVTGITSLALRHGGKLAGVNVLVTSLAGERRPLENNFVGANGKGGRAVTLLAGRAAVRSGESEAGLGMIEARHLAPRPRVVAEFTGLLDRRRAWGTRGQTGLPADFRQRAPEIHGSLVSPRTYLGLVRIEVTAGATKVGELVGDGVVQFRLFPVAIDAGDGKVPAFQREARLVVARQGELSGLKAVHRMARITTILMCRIRELAGMWVTVAV